MQQKSLKINQLTEKEKNEEEKMTPQNNRLHWGLLVYFFIIGIVLYSLYPSEDKGSGNWGLAFLVTIGLIIAIVGIIFFLKRFKRWIKTKIDKGKDKKKEPPKNKPRLHFWIEPSTLIMILFGYVFFTMAYANGLFNGQIVNIDTMIPPKDGYLYVPYFGLLVSFLLGGFLSLLDRSKIASLNIIGVLFLPTIFGLLALFYLWLMPFAQPHFVHIPAIDWIPLVNLLQNFPADPQLPKWLIFFIFTGLMYIAPRLPFVRYYYNTTFIRTLIIVIALIMFGEQMFIYGFIV
jgi:hypothetical protein